MSPRPPEHISGPTSRVMRDIARRRLVVKVHRLGARPMLELLLEVQAGADLDDALIRYAAADPATFRALGADRFPPLPLHRVS